MDCTIHCIISSKKRWKERDQNTEKTRGKCPLFSTFGDAWESFLNHLHHQIFFNKMVIVHELRISPHLWSKISKKPKDHEYHGQSEKYWVFCSWTWWILCDLRQLDNNHHSWCAKIFTPKKCNVFHDGEPADRWAKVK